MIFDIRLTEDGDVDIHTFPTKESWAESEKKDQDGVEVTLEDYLEQFVFKGDPVPKYVKDCGPFRMLISGEIITPVVKKIVQEIGLVGLD